MVDFCQKYLEELHAEQEATTADTRTHYPLMNLVDMYFWQLGMEGGVE